MLRRRVAGLELARAQRLQGGLVMKNGILLVDYSNTVRATGASAREAVLQAGAARMRPVVMTTVATVFGMLPVAFGSGDGAEFRAPMGIISIGGMASSTLLTLLVVPVAYTLMDDAQGFLRRNLKERGLRRGRSFTFTFSRTGATGSQDGGAKT